VVVAVDRLSAAAVQVVHGARQMLVVRVLLVLVVAPRLVAQVVVEGVLEEGVEEPSRQRHRRLQLCLQYLKASGSM